MTQAEPMTPSEREKVMEMYRSMSDSGLIDLLCAFKADYQNARARDDANCMSFCEERMEILEGVIRNHRTRP